MASELKYVAVDAVERNFLTPAMVDAKSIVSWTSLVLGGGGTVAAAILTLAGVEAAAGPVGWIAAAIGLAGGIGVLFIESRGDKLARARAKLEKELTESVNATCDSIWTQLEKNLSRLVEKKIDLVISELTKIGKVVDSLSSAQVELADSLRLELRTLNMTFTGKIASAVFGEETAAAEMAGITTAARIPGVCTLLCEEQGGAGGEDFRARISDLIAEDVRSVAMSEDKAEFISGVLDGFVCAANIDCENESKTVIIRTDSKDIRLYNRLRLLEQFVPYRIGG